MPAAVESMLYRGEVPWHGLGNQINHHDIDRMKVDAGMDWTAEKTPVLYDVDPDGDTPYYEMDDRFVLYRSDNHYPLGMVGSHYKVVQPPQILEFFRDLTATGGFHIETAGVLFSGRRLWALARYNKEAALSKKDDDILRPFLLLATSLDGTFATRASFTTIRVVCNNTLQMAIHSGEDAVKIRHNQTFDEQQVKHQLGAVNNGFQAFMEAITPLTKKKVTTNDVKQMYGTVIGGKQFIDLTVEDQYDYIETNRTVRRALESYHNAPGQLTAAAKGTMWGAVNGITHFIDFNSGKRTPDARLDNAWFGPGKEVKQRAMEYALDF